MSEKEAPISPKEQVLNQYVQKITNTFGEGIVKEAYINLPNFHLPTLLIDKSKWQEVALFLKEDVDFKFNYLMNLSGIDYEQYMEVIYHFHAIDRNEYLAVKVQTDRDGGEIPTVKNIWQAADWQEREVYDLLGIKFTGREISRILLPDEWIGHPLRKDYVPYDKGV